MNLPGLDFIPSAAYDVTRFEEEVVMQLPPLKDKAEAQYTAALVFTAFTCLTVAFHALLLPPITSKPFTPCSSVCCSYVTDTDPPAVAPAHAALPLPASAALAPAPPPLPAAAAAASQAIANRARTHFILAALPTIGILLLAGLGAQNVKIYDCPTRSLAFNITATVTQAIAFFYAFFYIALWGVQGNYCGTKCLRVGGSCACCSTCFTSMSQCCATVTRVRTLYDADSKAKAPRSHASMSAAYAYTPLPLLPAHNSINLAHTQHAARFPDAHAQHACTQHALAQPPPTRYAYAQQQAPVYY